MKIKKYEVSDMKEALRMIKEDLGSDAVILSTRKVMKGNNFGLFARPILEVTAAIEYNKNGNNGQSSPKQPVKQNIQNDYGYEEYPSAYTAVNKQKNTIQKQRPQAPVKNTYNPYGKMNNYSQYEDSMLTDAMAEAGILDDDDFLAPPRRTVKRNEFDVEPAFTPDEENFNPTKDIRLENIHDVRYESKYNQESIVKKENVPQKSSAEIEAEKMVAILKAAGLDKFSNLLEDIGDIKKQLANMQSNINDNIAIDLPQKLKEYHAQFLKNGVDDIISYRLLKSIEKVIEDKDLTPTQIKSVAIDRLAELLPLEKDFASIITDKIIALTGPTGVGKTTTIAKIAATMALKYGKKVCLITIDNFRIGAVEQLKTYAEIVNLPLYVATSPDELKRVIAKVKTTYDSILIDSMGRGQFDTTQIQGIRSFIDCDPRIMSVLVISMASNHTELYDTYDKYEVLKPDYLIFTKLDETKYFGPLINLPIKKKVPLLLVTTGQNVPDDMEIPDGKKIARRMLQEIPTQWSDK